MALQEKIKSLLGHNITKGALGTFVLNVMNQALLFSILILLARMMSPEDFGLYSVILSVMVLLALPFTGGFLTFIIRHISKYSAAGDAARLKGVLNFSMLWVFGGAIVLSNIVFFLAPFIWQENAEFYQLGASFIFFNAMLLFYGAYFRGFRHVIIGRFFEFFMQPFLLIVMLAALFVSGYNASLQSILSFHIFSIVAAVVLFIIFSLFRAKPLKVKATYDVKIWIRSAVPFILAVGLVIANMHIDIVMVGALASEEEAGLYRVASRVAAFVPFFLFALNNALAPRISGLYTQGKTEQLQHILTLSSRIVFALTMPVALCLLIFPAEILDLIFGSIYGVAATTLIILVFANLFNVMMGQVGQVMALTGYEKETAYTVLIALIINVTLNYILVPTMGIEGAAIATATSIIIWNMALSYLTVKKTGLHCTALGPIGKRTTK